MISHGVSFWLSEAEAFAPLARDHRNGGLPGLDIA
jgi:hypothetical protein